tara:strand:- start:1223 stop:2299 length:1077 start_codon:yes stop_codon:yes gene_type:complete
MVTSISKYLCYKTASIKSCLSKINASGHNTIFIINKKRKLLGSLTDGDIRRALLRNLSISSSIKEIYNKNPKFVLRDKYSESDIKDIFDKEQINLLPIVNDNNKIISVISWESIFRKKKKIRKSSVLKNTSIIVMAGGKGTRLKPYTNILPKPLLPINDKAIIEHIIDNYRFHGAKKIKLSINFKNHIIKAFFAEKNYKKEISFIEEKKSLGTCGSLGLMEKKTVTTNFILSNCDTIIDIDFKKLLENHKRSKSIMTLVISDRYLKFSYGSIITDSKGYLEQIVEKPDIKFQVNVGMYVFNKKVLEYIDRNKSMDINYLIKFLKKKDHKISVFKIEKDNWLDTGQINELSKAKSIIEF